MMDKRMAKLCWVVASCATLYVFLWIFKGGFNG